MRFENALFFAAILVSIPFECILINKKDFEDPTACSNDFWLRMVATMEASQTKRSARASSRGW